MGEYQTKESPGRIIGEHYETISSKKHDSSRQERMSSLPASEWAVAESQRGMTQDWVKFVWQGKRPERRASSWEEGLRYLPVDEWAVAETQRGMTQDEVEIICQGSTPWKTGIFVRGRVELFTGGWVSCSWDPKRSDAGWSGNSMSRCNSLKNGHLR